MPGHSSKPLTAGPVHVAMLLATNKGPSTNDKKVKMVYKTKIGEGLDDQFSSSETVDQEMRISICCVSTFHHQYHRSCECSLTAFWHTAASNLHRTALRAPRRAAHSYRISVTPQSSLSQGQLSHPCATFPQKDTLTMNPTFTHSNYLLWSNHCQLFRARILDEKEDHTRTRYV